MKCKSEILGVLHENAVAMYKVGGITEASMREYDEMCLKSNKTVKKSSSVYADDISVKRKQFSPVTA